MKTRKSSIRIDMISFFSVMMIFTLVVVGIVVFSSWKASSDEMIEVYEKDAYADIHAKMEAYLNIPLQINQMSHYSIENEIVDIDNEKEREIYFSGIIKSTGSSVYSFGYGTEDGAYYGARRNPDNEIEIMRSNADTMWNAWYLATNEDLTAGKLMEQRENYDPRTRDWYMSATKKGESVFSPTYIHFIMNDLAITAAYPVHDGAGKQKGVLATTFILSEIDAFLESVVAPKNASAFIFERNTGEVIASTEDMPRFIAFPDKPMERITIDQLENDLFSKAYQEYLATTKDDFVVEVDKESHGVNIMEYQKNGLDWIIITTLPRSQFLAPIMRGFRTSLFFFLLVLTGSVVLLVKSSNNLLRPIKHLIEIAEKFSEGDFTPRATVFKDDEIGMLAQAFNRMAERFHATMDQSEEKLRVRTTEMEKVNKDLTGETARVRYTLNSVGKGFIATDMFGDVTMMNAEAEALTGWTQKHAQGVPFDEVFHVVDGLTGERCHSMVIQVFEQGTQVEFDCNPVLISKDGGKNSIEGMASPIADEKGKKLGVVILFTAKRAKGFNALNWSS